MKHAISSALLVVALFSSVTVAAELAPVGKPAPDFFLRDQQVVGRGLKDFRGKWVVLFFYERDFSRECVVQAKAFQRDLAKYEQANAVVIGVSVDGPETHKALADVHKLQFILLSDPMAEVATAYGSFNQQPVSRIAARNTFLIDPSGNVVRVFSKINPALHSEHVLKALQELTKPPAP